MSRLDDACEKVVTLARVDASDSKLNELEEKLKGESDPAAKERLKKEIVEESRRIRREETMNDACTKMDAVARADGFDIRARVGSFEVLEDATGKFWVGARSGGPLPSGERRDGPYKTHAEALKQAKDLAEDYK